MKYLSIDLYSNNDANIFIETKEIDDEFVLSLLNDNITINSNLSFNNIYLQNKSFSMIMRDYFYNNIKESIVNHNNYKNRYNNNNDVYLHVRLGDATKWNPGLEYYDKALSSLEFDNGYISSDTINHPICMNLIRKYNLKPLCLVVLINILYYHTDHL